MRAFWVVLALLSIAATASAQEGALGLDTPRSAREPNRPAARAQPATTYVDPSDVAANGYPDDLSARRALLDTHLLALSMRSSGRVGDGIVPILIGGTYIGIGVAANDTDPRVGRYLWVTGSLNVLSGALYFGLSPNPSRAYTAFQASAGDVAAQVRIGEHFLRSAAHKRRASRYLQGSIQLATTVASVPLLLGGGGLSFDNPYDWVVTTTAAIGIVGAITTVIRSSEDERRYHQYRDRFPSSHLSTQRPSGTSRFASTFRAFPVAGGGIFLATSTF